jgi:hypothetical protein
VRELTNRALQLVDAVWRFSARGRKFTHLSWCKLNNLQEKHFNKRAYMVSGFRFTLPAGWRALIDGSAQGMA